MMETYIVNEHGVPVREADMDRWNEWITTHGQEQTFLTEYPDVRISTLFLGINHALPRTDVPILWETIVFIRCNPTSQERCGGTREQAEAQHSKTVADFLNRQPTWRLVWWRIVMRCTVLLKPLRRRLIDNEQKQQP